MEKIFCKLFGWHRPNKDLPKLNDGISNVSCCKHCGNKILRDSQGNWFAVKKYTKKEFVLSLIGNLIIFGIIIFVVYWALKTGNVY